MSTTTKRPRHKTVKARTLRAGDLMRCGGSGSMSYVLVTRVALLDGGRRVAVYIDDGGQLPWTHDGTADVALSTHGMTDAELEEAR